MSTTYRTQKAANRRRSLLLLTLLGLLLLTTVALLGHVAGLAAPIIAAIAATVVSVSTFSSWFYSDKLVIKLTQARPVEYHQNKQLHNVVAELAIVAQIPMPKIYQVIDRAPNAFATGRNPERGVIAFTTGLLAMMDRAELEGVVAHELAHIRNGDTLVASVSAATAGSLAIISDLGLRFLTFGGRSRNVHPALLLAAFVFTLIAPVAGFALKAAVSRRREALADATAVELTRNPAGLRSALQKLLDDSSVVTARSRAVAHVWLENPLPAGAVDRLFATHPKLSERITALAALEGVHPGSYHVDAWKGTTTWAGPDRVGPTPSSAAPTVAVQTQAPATMTPTAQPAAGPAAGAGFWLPPRTDPGSAQSGPVPPGTETQGPMTQGQSR